MYLSTPQRPRPNFAKMFDSHKTRMIGLPRRGGKEHVKPFDRIPERDGQTDEQTDI